MSAARVEPRFALTAEMRGMEPSATLAVQERARAIVASGRNVFMFGLGQSPFPVPSEVVETLRANAFRKDYLAVRGLRELRERVADYHRRRQGLVFSPDDIVVGPGSKELLFLLQLVSDADILLPTPAWVSYAPQARLAGRRLELLSTRFEAEWLLEPETLDRAAAARPDRPKLLVLTYPNNPTGTTFDPTQLAELAEVARKHRIVIVSDEIYGELSFDDSHFSIARHYPEGTLVAGGLSKWCGAGGWRLGVLSAPRELAPLVDAVAVAASETFTSTSAPIQHAAVRAFSGGASLDGYLARARRILGALAAWTTDRLRDAGLRVATPRGGFYVLPDFAEHREALLARGIETSPALARALLEHASVACLPGTDFGRSPDELTIRLSLVDFDGEGAMTALRSRGDEPIDEAFLLARCGRVLEGIDRLCDWVTRGL